MIHIVLYETNNPDIVLAQILFTFSLQVSKNSTKKLSFHNLPYWISKETEESTLAPSTIAWLASRLSLEFKVPIREDCGIFSQ